MGMPYETDTAPWWERTDEDLVATLTALVNELRANDQTRRMFYRVWDDLYDGTCFGDAGLSDATRNYLSSGLGDVSFNYAARALDFVHSKITSELPSVRAAGKDADHDQYLRAKALSRFIVGATEEVGLSEAMSRAVHCALRVGTGAIISEFIDGVPFVEPVHPRELLVDPDDARHGNPRCLYRIRPTDRRSLMDRYPDRYADIEAAGTSGDPGSYDDRPGDWQTNRRTPDSVDLYQAWVLPAHGQPGLHVTCLDNGIPLRIEEFEHPRFPIAFFRAWEPAVGTGFFGRGLLERIDGPQFAIDELVRHVDESMRHANLKVFLNDETGIAANGILDDPTVGTIITLDGAAIPQFVTPSVLGPGREVMAVIAEWRSSLYQIAGMDESAVSSQVKAGVDSAIAMRTYHDFQSQGYVDMMRRIGVLAVDCVERLIDAANREYGGRDSELDSDESSDQSDWEVRYAKGGSGLVVRWSEVDMDRDTFVIELEETSPIPDTRAGRQQQIEEDAAAGRIPPEYMTRLREDPDGWWAERLNAQEDVDYIDWLVDQLVDPSLPMPMLMDEMNAEMAIDRLRREVLAAVRRPQSDPRVVARLQDFAAQIVDSMTPPEAPGPNGGQVPPPNSGMLPGVPGMPVPPTGIEDIQAPDMMAATDDMSAGAPMPLA